MILVTLQLLDWVISSPHAKGDVWENRADGRSIMIFSPAWYKDQHSQDETDIHQTGSPMLQWRWIHRIIERHSWSWHPQRLLRYSRCAGIQKPDRHILNLLLHQFLHCALGCLQHHPTSVQLIWVSKLTQLLLMLMKSLSSSGTTCDS